MLKMADFIYFDGHEREIALSSCRLVLPFIIEIIAATDMMMSMHITNACANSMMGRARHVAYMPTAECHGAL